MASSWRRFLGQEVTEYHKDGSKTIRDAKRKTSETYDSDGKLKEFTHRHVAARDIFNELITFGGDVAKEYAVTYDKDGIEINRQEVKDDE